MLFSEVTVLEAEAKAAVSKAANARVQLLAIEEQRIRTIARANKGDGKREKGIVVGVEGKTSSVCFLLERDIRKLFPAKTLLNPPPPSLNSSNP